LAWRTSGFSFSLKLEMDCYYYGLLGLSQLLFLHCSLLHHNRRRFLYMNLDLNLN
jgi:hypothetical protein